jgi:hypothetical protein
MVAVRKFEVIPGKFNKSKSAYISVYVRRTINYITVKVSKFLPVLKILVRAAL